MKVSEARQESYVFRLQLMDSRGAAIAERALTHSDFSRAALATYWKALCAGRVHEYAPALDQAQIEPRFLSLAGKPTRAEGFRVIIPIEGGEPFACDFPIRYFAAAAARLRARFALAKSDGDDGTLLYSLESFLDDRDRAGVEEEPFELGPAVTAIPLVSRSLGELRPLEPWDRPSANGTKILVGRSVVEEVCEQASRHPDREVGGLLLGNLCRDPADGQVFVQITCTVSGEGSTESTATTLTFTPESFQRARGMIDLRARAGCPREVFMGWDHSHPFRFCQECPLPTPPECVDKILFFSSDDVQVMESTFYMPFMVGLLSGVGQRLEQALGHAPLRCFHWNNGEVVRGGFYVFED